MLQKYCAYHEKVKPRHTNSCNCHAKWSLQSNTSVTWNLQTFHGSSVGGFKHWHHRARNACACHAKASFRTLFKSTTPGNLFATLTNSCTCRVLCNVPISLHLPRKRNLNLQKRPETVSFERFWLPKRSGAMAWCKFYEAQLQQVPRRRHFLTILTSKSLSRHSVAQRGANFAELNFQKCSETTVL